jgi:hypothetical protein
MARRENILEKLNKVFQNIHQSAEELSHKRESFLTLVKAFTMISNQGTKGEIETPGIVAAWFLFLVVH